MDLVSIIAAVSRLWIKPSLSSIEAARNALISRFSALRVIFSDFLSTSVSFKEPSHHIQLGVWGERMAAKELKRRGFKILYRNYRGPHGGEIDLVCRDQETLVFVEVKTRSKENHSRPFDAVTRKKKRLLKRGALSWLRLLGTPDITFRFDVVEVIATVPPEVRLLERAFHLEEPFHY